MPRSEYRSDYSPPRRSGGGTRVAEYDEEIDIRERRDRRRPRERDFLRDAYEQTEERNGQLVLIDEEERSQRGGGRRDKEYREEEVIIARSGNKDRDRDRERDRPRRRGYEEEEIRIRERERDRAGSVRSRSFEEEDFKSRRRERGIEHEEVREELVYRPRRDRDRRYDHREQVTEEWIHVPRERPAVAKEVEEWRFAPRPRFREEEVETINIRERERPREEFREEVIDIRERDVPRDYAEEAIRVREREREPLRGYQEEEIRITERERERPREYDEEIRIRERERERPREYREEEIRITERDREREPERRERPRESGTDFSRRKDFKEEIIIKHNDRDGAAGHNDQIVIRRKESQSPPAAPTPPPAPPELVPVRAPPIHQEIITHHRHIDHGFEQYRAPAPAPPRARSPSPPSPQKSSYEEINIRHNDRNGRHEDDIIIKRGESNSRPSHNRHRSMSVDGRSLVARRPPAIDEEADYYARKTAERAYIGEAYNGATKDWAIVDVPPGTNRVRMDGVGGASEEITWQRYNGVRRSRFIPESGREIERDPGPEPEPERRRYVGQKSKTDHMWTEITKDLVVKEAIEGFGYEYEETEWFFYVMKFLNYEDVRRLVQISDDIRSRRRERIKQIEWETQMPREPERPPPRSALPERPWEEERERIVEREWYDRRSPRPALPPPPTPPMRVTEREKIVVIRNER